MSNEMTVSQLIEELQKLDGSLIVICQKDGEGNGFSPLAGVDGTNCGYQEDSTWSGEVGITHLTDALKEKGYSDEDVLSDSRPCAVLYPVN